MSKFRKEIAMLVPVLLAGCFMLVNAQAQPDSADRPRAFTHMDKDGDGQISEKEYEAFREQRMAGRSDQGKQKPGRAPLPAFTEIDSNVDGQLDSQEFASARKAHRGKKRAMRMGQGNGPMAEKAKGPGKEGKANMPSFSDFDLDGDGTVIETEFNQARANRMSKMASEGRHMKHAKDAPDFSSIDSDGDGGISAVEFATHQAEHHRLMHGETDPSD